MKLEAKFLPGVLQMSGSAAHKIIVSLAVFSLLASGSISVIHAAPGDDPIKIIKALAHQNPKAPEYTAEVTKLVQQFPKEAEAIIAEAVKDEPAYACDVMKAGILALTPANTQPDAKLVAAIVAAVVTNIQATNPDLMNQIVSCALDVAKDAGPAILDALAGLYSGPNGINKTAANNGGFTAPGVGASPTPMHKPPPSPPPAVTGVTPI